MEQNAGGVWSRPDRPRAGRARAGRRESGSHVAAGLCLAALWVAGCGGCSAFNPAFLNVFDATGAGQLQTIDNAGGHVVIQVVNNASVDEELISFVRSLDPLADESRFVNLHPRVRMRLRTTFVDGTFQTTEFITGSPDFVDPAFDATSTPDLNQNDFDNAVVLCDVASVQIEPGSAIEVFIPVNITEFERVETSGTGGQITLPPVARQQTPPGFRALQVDLRDADGNVTLAQNIDVRDVPAPITGVTCGTVVTLTINGTLAVPFLRTVSSEPSFLRGDTSTIAQIGGSFEFRVAAQ